MLMKITVLRAPWRATLLWVMLLGLSPLTPRVAAFPPALPHTFYGLIRDELGNPLPAGAAITLESSSGVKVYGVVSDIFEAGVNYRLRVPLDAGLTNDRYKPTALHPAAPFKITIRVGATVFLPIEMTHDFAHIGEPGKSTLLNLTLGEDSNGDGLPDAWQRRINADLGKVTPGGDADGDGLTNEQEYLAGTYASDPANGFALSIVRLQDSVPVLAFTAITGRTYIILGSSDLNSGWSPVQVRLAGAAATSTPLSSYTSTGVSKLEVEVATPAGEAAARFFKLMLE
jgi:hypothetical protein